MTGQANDATGAVTEFIMAKAIPSQQQQGGTQTPAQQPSQSGTATPQQQGSGTIFRDWASI